MRPNDTENRLTLASRSDDKTTVSPLGLIVMLVAICVSFLVWAGWIPLDTTTLHEELSGTSSGTHWLGTNILGQDIFARLVAAVANSTVFGLVIAVSAVFTGALLGVLAARNRSLGVDFIVTTMMNTVESLPVIFWAILLAFGSGGSIVMVALAIALGLTSNTIRIVRAAAGQAWQSLDTQTAISNGVSTSRIVRYHIVPRLRGIIGIQLLLVATASIKIEAVLGFLGLSDLDFIGFGTLIQESIPLLLAQNYVPFLAIALTFTGLIGFSNLWIDRFNSRQSDRVFSHA